MSKPIIEVKGISKRYKLGTIGAQTMRDEVEAFFARFKKTKSPATSHSLPAASSKPPLDSPFFIQPSTLVSFFFQSPRPSTTRLSHHV